MNRLFKIALVGNPNSGKTSLFNQLTGLRQKVGNFPGVTVEKKIGTAKISSETDVQVIDFPGLYSFFPNSKDERIVLSTFLNPKDEAYPDLVLYTADVTNLERHLLLLTQIQDLGFPVIMALTMQDLAERDGIIYHPEILSKYLNIPIVPVSSRTGDGFENLKSTIEVELSKLSNFQRKKMTYKLSPQEKVTAESVAALLKTNNIYQAKLIAHHQLFLPFLSQDTKNKITHFTTETGFEDLKYQVRETMQRYDKFLPVIGKAFKKANKSKSSVSDKIDNIVLHNTLGPIIFFLLMVLVFQAIYSWSSYPMDWIEGLFGYTSEALKNSLPDNWFSGLLTDGIIAGLGGVLVFIPQIAILFFLISLLEEAGYMARAVFLFDKLMQRFGLNGRSIVALISGGACAIPAVMSTRTIGNWKERLITILVTPFISCSARIPVYTVLIGFAVPAATIWGIFNSQGLAFMGLYMLGIIAALGAAFVFKLILKSDETSYLLIELPEYRIPVMKNVFFNVWEKVKSFIIEAGQIILVISVILWFMASYGPAGAMEQAELEAISFAEERSFNDDETANLVAGKKIEASYAGHLGKFIEPAIKPLGFDWKIGIALITSFAAREVFVGTMATIYSIGSESDEGRIKDKMALEIRPDNGKPVYNSATSLSLLIFYVFAMQCMSTLAVVKRETNSWKWPTIQFIFMTGLAYLGSFLVYQFLS